MSTAGEIASFHRLERQIYARLLSLQTPVSTVRNIMALWIYLQFIGIDLLHYISDCRNNSVLARFIGEAEWILHCIAGSPLDAAIPFTSSMATEELNLRFFRFNKDAIARGIAYVMESMGAVIFDSAGAYNGRSAPDPVDLRTLFITSDNRALRKAGIVEFFHRRWGDCVENVVFEQATRGVGPIYGRILLREEHFVEYVFENRQVLVMEIEGSQCFVRKFAVS